MKFLNITGTRFGRLVAIQKVGMRGGQSVWECRCDCGAIKMVPIGYLRCGDTKSCGCWRIEWGLIKATKHGQSKTRLYRIWCHAKARCENSSDHAYKDYGGRGIYMCSRWSASFEAFAQDMGEPASGMQLERIDNSGPYSLDNCKWATPSEQANNRRSNRKLSANGRTLTVAQWSKEIGIPTARIHGRLRLGWSAERALIA